MNIKVVVDLNGTILNSRNDEGKIIPKEFSGDSSEDLKITIRDWFPNNINLENNALSLMYKNNNGEDTLYDLDGEDLPDIPSDANGNKVVMIYVTNRKMKAGKGLTYEERKEYLRLVLETEEEVEFVAKKLGAEREKLSSASNQEKQVVWDEIATDSVNVSVSVQGDPVSEPLLVSDDSSSIWNQIAD